MRRGLFAAIVFWSLGCLAAPGACRAEGGVKLGVILPLSGDVANVGTACRNAIEMSREALSPEVRGKLDVVFEDDAMQAKNTVTAWSLLLNRDRVNAVMSFSSGCSKAVSPLADQRGVPVIAIASDPKIVEGRKEVVNFWVTPEAEAQEALSELRRRDWKRIVRISTIQDGVVAVLAAFDRENKNQAAILLDEQFAMESRDFRTFINKVKGLEGVDAIFAELMIGQIGLFAKQTRELGVTLPLFGVELFEDPGEVKLSHGALVGQWYVQADDPEGHFLENYMRRFPHATPFSAGNCYDVVQLIGDAIGRGMGGERLNEYLHSVRDFHGVMGVFSSTASNTFTLPATVKVVKEDGFEKLRR